ncbi:hypothetical protein KP509_12G025400 [Ceratopteris richardii]|uniref:protein-histidine N-methyltransferase n=1 Tax=Ceratopteris richardii TaxID=49495 RepID=A0A8T2TLV6_CERRI|nr:hypothetical protein KP509_12G025400 [Ceratopteris richardii]
MKVPLLLTWLSGLTSYGLKHETYWLEELLKEDSHPLLCPFEVLPSQVPKINSFALDTVALEGGLTLFKINSAGIPSSEYLSRKLEGGLGLSKCAVQLVNTLRREIQDGQLSFRGKRVLELGCGHGLPGIFACLKGAAAVHFQDVSSEMLKNVTISNVHANLEHSQSRCARLNGCRRMMVKKRRELGVEIRYYAGDWSHMDSVLSLARQGYADSAYDGSHLYLSHPNGESSLTNSRNVDYDEVICTSSHGQTSGGRESASGSTKYGSRAWESSHSSANLEAGYDVILMSETVYTAQSLPKLYGLIIKVAVTFLKILHYHVLLLHGKESSCMAYFFSLR